LYAQKSGGDDNFAYTRTSLKAIESIASCIVNDESVLLVGDTGVGKTFLVQFLAKQLNQNLIVLVRSIEREEKKEKGAKI
jgi:midasin (ATPase involved in ribosome maturation)